MNKPFVVLNVTTGKYISYSDSQGEFSFNDGSADINSAIIWELERDFEQGALGIGGEEDMVGYEDGVRHEFKKVYVQVIKTIVPVVEDLPIVEHITARNKTIYGVIRKDITVEQARVLDPYTFPKDGGFFIRQKNDK